MYYVCIMRLNDASSAVLVSFALFTRFGRSCLLLLKVRQGAASVRGGLRELRRQSVSPAGVRRDGGAEGKPGEGTAGLHREWSFIYIALHGFENCAVVRFASMQWDSQLRQTSLSFDWLV